MCIFCFCKTCVCVSSSHKQTSIERNIWNGAYILNKTIKSSYFFLLLILLYLREPPSFPQKTIVNRIHIHILNSIRLYNIYFNFISFYVFWCCAFKPIYILHKYVESHAMCPFSSPRGDAPSHNLTFIREKQVYKKISVDLHCMMTKKNKIEMIIYVQCECMRSSKE